MFIGHLPAGYLATRAIIDRYSGLSSRAYRFLMGVGLLVSVLPDVDLLYFYLLDGHRHLHHTYWIHLPIFWLGLLIASVVLATVLGNRLFWLLVAVVYSNVFLHLLLDTVVGHIFWFYPFSDQSIALFEVKPKYGWWVWNFVFHWTFLFELALWGWAVIAFVRTRPKCLN